MFVENIASLDTPDEYSSDVFDERDEGTLQHV
jgi:hypothetical protein